ncbi:MAG: hypothetical protein HY821_06835 [Acidobacteria bacterium]|nr:hypothetical protein [Acidobacteriota bacterium]
MKRSNLSLALSLILVFASGVAVGALGHRYFAAPAQKREARKSPEEYRRAYVGEMTTRLKLDDAQVKSLNSIMDETWKKFRELREKQMPDFKAIQDGQVAAINAMLSPQQQAEYATMRKEREAKRKKSEKERGQ